MDKEIGHCHVTVWHNGTPAVHKLHESCGHETEHPVLRDKIVNNHYHETQVVHKECDCPKPAKVEAEPTAPIRETICGKLKSLLSLPLY